MEEVNSPKHYQGHGMEAIDVIDAFELGFNLGNVIKYVLREGRKGEPGVNLMKAKWYLERELASKTKGWVYREEVSSEASPEAIREYYRLKSRQCQESVEMV